MFRATIGQGYAGGVQGHTEELVDLAGTSGNKYYKYYIPGVGTPFPEVNDLDYSTPGLAFATYGEERVNWGLLRIIDALRRTSGLTEISDAECYAAVNRMTSNLGSDGPDRRYTVFNEFLKAADLAPKLKQAVTQPEPGKPKLLGIKLYVYGFSRGAASARAFVNWLSELLPGGRRKGSKPELCLKSGDVKIPLSIEFLGLLDTVASVGIANIAPFAEGHMGWADGTMELPDNGLIKKCTHLVSSHEQRLCFPLDSICRSDGTYPSYATEVVYPGMHSDIGGGYPREIKERLLEMMMVIYYRKLFCTICTLQHLTSAHLLNYLSKHCLRVW
ncbi:T6SS phospholipase effector Tle1-like catalytic domain-containing protein [Klebsiella pneumoniae]|uniref:T6SS phospholipase effector Tle1-like catalytic domain-containing protein n=1 Tax=Klebsiella pneumoniae TaxID=573 RepID=UPI00359C73C5